MAKTGTLEPEVSEHADDTAVRSRYALSRVGNALRHVEFWVVVVVVAVLSYLVLLPLAYLIYRAFIEDGQLTWASFDRALSGDVAELALNSFIFMLGSSMVTVVIGTILAFLTERTDLPFRRAIYVGALVPIIVPGILYTIAWVFLAGPGNGALNIVFESSIGVRPFNIFSLTGMIVAQSLDEVPIMFLLMLVAFRSMDPALEEAALMSGASTIAVVRKMTLPLARPAILAGALIVSVRNLEAFETPRILGLPANIWVITSRIFQVLNDEFPPDYGQAAAYSLILLVLVSIGIFIHARWIGEKGAFATVTGRGYRPRKMSLGSWRWPITAAVAVYFFIAILLPLGILVYVSFQPFYSAPSLESLLNSSLEPYRAIFREPESAGAIRNSLVLGVGAATIGMLLAATASWIVIRSRVPGRWLIDNLAFLPLVFPGIVLGASLLFVYLRNPLPIYGTTWILLIAYITRFIPYAIRYSSTAMYQISAELEEAAAMAGSGWFSTFRRVTLPLMAPGLIAGWVYIFILALRELSASLLLYPPGGEVLSVVIWDWWYDGLFPELAALGVMMMLLVTVLTLVARKLSGVTFSGGGS